MAEMKLGRRLFVGAGVLALAESWRVAQSVVRLRQMPTGALSSTVPATLPHATTDAYMLPPQPIMDAFTRREWATFRRRFLLPSGQVIDTGNGGVSHSEGQGIGMLCAVAWNDADAFDRMFLWTEQHLHCRKDALYAWRYIPGASPAVPDLNNATDGDMLIATALFRASQRWQRPVLADMAAEIARDVHRLLLRQVAGWTVLLPGAVGFEKSDSVVINPSYYALQFMPEMQSLAPSPQWDRLRRDGPALIMRGRFGRWQLPPDWLSISRADGALRPAQGWFPRFSYDAIRVPLHLIWSGLMPRALEQALEAFWAESSARRPAWVDLQTGETASYPASFGMQRIMELTLSRRRDLMATSVMPEPPGDYYSTAIALLARLCSIELQQRNMAGEQRPVA